MNRLRDLFSPDEVDPESRNRTLLIGGLVLLVAFALLLVGVGYYVDRVQPQRETVFVVGDKEYSYAYLEDRVDAAHAQGQFITSDIQFGIAQLISDIQNEELVRLMAADQGITVTDEEMDAAMREDAGVPPDAPNDVMASILRDHLQNLGLDLDTYEEIIEAEVLEEKLKEGITAELPEEAEQVDLFLIQTDTDAQAAQALQRLRDGEAFEDVATEISAHPSSADGGAVGWTPAELLDEELAEAVFEQEPGTLSSVIETEQAFYVARVDGKETRELSEEVQADLTEQIFNERLEAEAEKHDLTVTVTVEQAQRIADHLRSSGV